MTRVLPFFTQPFITFCKELLVYTRTGFFNLQERDEFCPKVDTLVDKAIGQWTVLIGRRRVAVLSAVKYVTFSTSAASVWQWHHCFLAALDPTSATATTRRGHYITLRLFCHVDFSSCNIYILYTVTVRLIIIIFQLLTELEVPRGGRGSSWRSDSERHTQI